MRTTLIIFLCLILSAGRISADTIVEETQEIFVLESSPDTVLCTVDPYDAGYKFNAKQLILPASLITVGAVGVATPWLQGIKRSVRDGFADIRGDHYFRIDNYIQYLPVAAHLGLGAVGVKCRHPFKERFAAALTATAATALMTNVIKYCVNEKRPDSNARNSFPSGHTATVFMGAELVRLEYNTGIAVGAYSVAVLTGLLRMYNDRHWINDVIAGAGIGILSARIGYWMLPVYKRWFGWKNTSASAPTLVAVPAYDPLTSSFALSAAISF